MYESILKYVLSNNYLLFRPEPFRLSMRQPVSTEAEGAYNALMEKGVAGCEQSDPQGHYIDDVLSAAQIRTKLAIEKVTGDSRFADEAVRDTSYVLRTWAVGRADPWLNGVWVAYIAGASPRAVLRPIETSPIDLLAISRSQARSLLDLPEADQAPPALPLPSATEIAQLISGAVEASIILDCRDPSKWPDIPQHWRHIDDRRVRENGNADLISTAWQRRLPALYKFLTTQCVGVALFADATQPPALLYLCRTFVGEDRKPELYAFRGWIPLAAGAAEWANLDNFPSVIRDFYSEVHNGLTGPNGGGGVPFPAHELVPIGQAVSGEDIFGASHPPFDVATLVPIVDLTLQR